MLWIIWEFDFHTVDWVLGEEGKNDGSSNWTEEVPLHPALSRVKWIFQGLDKVVTETEVKAKGEILEEDESVCVRVAEEFQALHMLGPTQIGLKS